MKLSIIVPIYNAEKYINQCIESILCCNRDDMELILVDDGSSDSSCAICLQTAKRDSRVKVISKQNSGVSDARNQGIAAASGEYIMFLDADDFMRQESWPDIFGAMNSQRDFYAFSYWSLYGNGRCIEEPFPEGTAGKDLQKARWLLLCTPLFHTCWGKLFRSDIIKREKILFPSGVSIGEDYLFVLEYFKYVNTVEVISQPVLYYRQNDSGAMGSFHYDVRLANIKQIWNYCNKYIKELNLGEYEPEMEMYQFSSFSYFCRVLSNSMSYKEAKRLLKRSLSDREILELLRLVPCQSLGKKRTFEYRMAVGQHAGILVLYYKIKGACIKKQTWG